MQPLTLAPPQRTNEQTSLRTTLRGYCSSTASSAISHNHVKGKRPPRESLENRLHDEQDEHNWGWIVQGRAAHCGPLIALYCRVDFSIPFHR